MSELVQDMAWQADALRLRATTEMGTSEIGEAVGKHPATIRKLFARNPPQDRVLSSEEASEAFSAPEQSIGAAQATEYLHGTDPERSAGVVFSEPQTTVYDHLPSEEPPPEDDPEYTPLESDDRIVWTGENRRETAAFLGRGENGTIHAQKIELPERLAEFRAEAGEAVGPMPPVTAVTFEYEMESAMPVLKGTRQMALDLGPNAAPITESTVTFKSEKWPSGHFGMGDVVSGTFTARIVSTPAKEKFDKDAEEFVAAPMAYGALITEIEYEVGDDA